MEEDTQEGSEIWKKILKKEVRYGRRYSRRKWDMEELEMLYLKEFLKCINLRLHSNHNFGP